MISTLSLDSLDLVGPEVTDYIVHSGLEGLDMPDMRINNFDRPGEDGQFVSSALYSGRMLSISGSVKNTTCDQFEAARQSLIQACAISRDNNRYPILKRIEFTTKAGNSYFCEGQVTRVKLPVETITDFLINIVAPDPMIFGSSVVTSGQISRPSGGGVVYPVVYPAVYTSSTGGSAAVVNNGSASSWPTITLRGPLTNPVIYHQESGTLFALNYVLASGSTIVIDMKNKTVILDGSVSLLSSVDRTSGSDWFELLPGSNVLIFSTGSTGDAGTLEVRFFNAYIGV